MAAKVTVCIPTYNYARFLPDTIDSVLKQSFSDYEILIIDDCSSDNTADLIRHYEKKYKRIRFISNKVNIGMVNNWNLCLREANGEYIKFLFGDDLLSSSDALRRMASILDEKQDVSLVASARNLIDTNSRVLKVLSHFDDVILPGKAAINICLSMQKNLIGEPSAVMFRKKDAGRGFLPHYKQLVDQEMWFYLMEKGKLAYIHEPLCAFRTHADQQTEKNRKNMAFIEDAFDLYDEYINKPYITMGAFEKGFLRYNDIYKIWKMYAVRKLITRAAAIEKIDKVYGYRRFLFFYPLYKIYKPLLKGYRRFRKTHIRVFPIVA